jgi:hypothetical protein
MIVVAEKGDTSPSAEYPYQFYAKTNTQDTVTVVVNILMPVGGKETGLYRFPRPGESVMVDVDGSTSPSYYLIGYLPDTQDRMNNFLTNTLPASVPAEGEAGYNKEKKEQYDKQKGYFDAEAAALKAGEAMVLRYEQTGKTTPQDGQDERYSEIGFYSRPTLWRSTNDAYKGVVPPARKENETDADYSARLVTAGYPKSSGAETDFDHIVRATAFFPKIDRLNIQSSGDMRAAAKNYQLLKAKRFELLVNCPDTIHDDKELSKDELPLGDNPGDDAILHAGDAHIRARNRVVIKAGKEILLQVGKTAVSIKDDGLKVISKLVNSNLTNAYDATFNMSGKSGISMAGRNVKINADLSLGMRDTYGGSFSSNLGVVSIGGREIKAGVYDAVKYTLLVINAAAQYAQSIASGSMAVNGNVTDAQVGNYVKMATSGLIDLAELINAIIDVKRMWVKFMDQSKAMTQEKVAKEAEGKAKAAKDKLTAAENAETDAGKKLSKAQSAAVDAKREYEAAKTAYQDKVNTGANAEQELKDLVEKDKARQQTEEEAKKSAKAYQASQERLQIATASWERADRDSQKEGKEAASLWNTEVTKAAAPKPTPTPTPTPQQPGQPAGTP